MTFSGFFGAIVAGLVIGALGRLVVPGRNPIGCLLTILVGIVGSVGGLAIGVHFNLRFLPTLLIQVGIAALLVLAFSAAARSRSRYR
ncbi:MAG: GlsB/YeaQ/YmgE family stress response membrane protein [Actinomycetota bacterium]|nr:GlsB/YeaQ/YmgE family stress response membrane protein [Actinomycetota bacterium]